MNANAIEINQLSKNYRLFKSRRDRLRELLSLTGKKYHQEFCALQDVSFDIKKRRTIGIIGCNGSGKSTLLKIICGVLRPSRGDVYVNGRIAALLELGAGFNAEFTGRENVYMNLALMGLKRNEAEYRFPEIEAFAGIGDFIHQPVKTYSSGMYIRLAFSTAIHSEPDILVIDEALAVGDARFQQKCMAKIKEFCEQKTVLFVSHDMQAVKELCSKLYWLDGGKVIMEGAPQKVSEKYLEFMYGHLAGSSKDVENDVGGYCGMGEFKDFTPLDDGLRQFGDRRAIISGLRFLSGRGNRNVAYGGESAEIGLVITVHETIRNPIIGFICKDRLGRELVGDNSALLGMKVPPLQRPKKYIVRFKFRLWPNLYEGEYTITLAVADGELHDHVQCHWIHDALVIKSIPARVPGALISILDTEFGLVEVQ